MSVSYPLILHHRSSLLPSSSSLITFWQIKSGHFHKEPSLYRSKSGVKGWKKEVQEEEKEKEEEEEDGGTDLLLCVPLSLTFLQGQVTPKYHTVRYFWVFLYVSSILCVFNLFLFCAQFVSSARPYHYPIELQVSMREQLCRNYVYKVN